ncbi:hypothetical protein BLNAU_24767 [Blattamonas nauphoetae]|uniref:Uncharacterized protein n=1 Tax=Blattamonas nauphoetae TaxID=2049346 RepID=A0ABQ9WLI5_9EUKA|nr:hypothetical protein BLNAU_24767 [Blattamonas nauphoetae]
MELHSHVTSLVYYVLSFFTPKNVVDRLDDQPDQSTFLQRISNITSSLFTEIKPYLKHLFGHPGCFPGHPGVICFISFLIMFHAYFETDHPESLVPEIQQMHNDIQKEMSDEFYSSLRLACPDENFECQLIDTNQVTDRGWAFVFARLLERVGKERPFSDLEFQWLITFLSQRPQSMKLVFKKDGTFGIKLEDNIFGSATFHARSLCSLFTPTQPHHAPPLLTSFNDFIRQIDEKDLVLYIFDGWLSNLFAAVPPSTLLFTPDFIHLHTVLIRVMENRLDKPRYFPPSSHHFGPQLQSALEKSYLSFLEHSKDYFVHLSLNPFALERTGSDTILQFLASLLKSNLHYQNPFISFQKTLIKAMDASALSSSSPPLIRTTELVRYLSEKETISIVDRIVAHIDRNTFLDDDSLLRIYIFIQRQLKIDSLPQLFQNLGRTTNQYFSALKAFLSIDVDSFLPRRRTNSQPQYLFWYFTPEYNPPINNLFLYCPDTSRTKSEWKEVFFETILVMMRSLKLDKRLSSSTAKAHHVNLRFVIQKSLQFASPSAAHLTPTTLERWPPPRSREKHEPTVTESVLWTDHHITIHTRCEHPVIAHLLCKHGFYMLLLDDLTVYGSSSTAMSVLTHLIRSYRERDENMTQKRWLENGVMMCLNEEGWQDAMDFVHFQKQDFGYRKYESNITAQSKVMMNFCGANLSRVYD